MNPVHWQKVIRTKDSAKLAATFSSFTSSPLRHSPSFLRQHFYIQSTKSQAGKKIAAGWPQLMLYIALLLELVALLWRIATKSVEMVQLGVETFAWIAWTILNRTVPYCSVETRFRVHFQMLHPPTSCQMVKRISGPTLLALLYFTRLHIISE